MERIYHPIWKWEEIAYNMWGDVPDRRKALQIAIEFTGDHKLYGSYMKMVIKTWKYSCENALTDRYINRSAWLGHAAVALAHRIPEDIVREAWKELTDEQQLLANQEASRAIQAWEHSFFKDRELHIGVGAQMLLGWNS